MCAKRGVHDFLEAGMKKIHAEGVISLFLNYFFQKMHENPDRIFPPQIPAALNVPCLLEYVCLLQPQLCQLRIGW